MPKNGYKDRNRHIRHGIVRELFVTTLCILTAKASKDAIIRGIIKPGTEYSELHLPYNPIKPQEAPIRQLFQPNQMIGSYDGRAARSIHAPRRRHYSRKCLGMPQVVQ
jgi:hypothetical protein